MFWHLNSVLILNWIVLNTTIYLYQNGFGKGWCHKTQINKLKSKEDSFDYKGWKFQLLYMEKLMMGIFDWQQILNLMKDPHFQNSIKNAQAVTCSLFTLVVRNFLWNYKLVESMISSFRQRACKMSIRMYYPHSHWDLFPWRPKWRTG